MALSPQGLCCSAGPAGVATVEAVSLTVPGRGMSLAVDIIERTVWCVSIQDGFPCIRKGFVDSV